MIPALVFIKEKNLQQEYEEFLKTRYPERKTTKEDMEKKREAQLARFVELGKRKPKAKK